MFAGQADMPLESIRRINMPVKDGGMGIPSLVDSAEAAYVGSWATALPDVLRAISLPIPEILARQGNPFGAILTKVVSAQQHLGQFSTPAPLLAEGAFKVNQKVLTQCAVKIRTTDWHNDCTIDARHKAWARSCGGPGAGGWLMPASHLSAVLSDEEFRTGISLRLFLDQVPENYVCPFSSTPAAAKCGSQLDSQGLHLIACPVGGGLVGRHDSIRDVLRGLLVDQGFNTHVEQSLFAPTGELIGRSDLCWVNDRCMAVHIDVAIVSPASVAALKKGSAKRDGVAAELMENTKLIKYLSSRAAITPFVLEAGGRFGPKALRAVRSSFRESEAAAQAYQFITAQLVRANALAMARARYCWRVA